ncbi:MAG TPA: hypothetical protein VGJ20_22830 [Xanthobacteraceae bacterium]
MHRLQSLIRPVRWLRSFAAFAALAFALLICADDSDAQLAGALQHAASGIRITLSPPGSSTVDVAATALDHGRLAQAFQPAHPGGLAAGAFNHSSRIDGFAAGFLAAGLLGLLFGHGVFARIDGSASVFGLLFQLAVVGMLGRLVWTWWRGGEPAAGAQLSPRQLAAAYTHSRSESLHTFADVELRQTDYDAFGRLFREIRCAYRRNDGDALQTRLTPQMLSRLPTVFLPKGSRNAIDSDATLLKEDLAEAWREGNVEYAAVTIHWALREAAAKPVEASEVWTFSRVSGQGWVLSAVQQA